MNSQSLLFPTLKNYIENLQILDISEERREALNPFRAHLQQKRYAEEPLRINFICTHNSRRSHLTQVWAQAMAVYCGIQEVFCYSGGTEATALFPMAAKSLEDDGFEIEKLSESHNPVYSIKFGPNEHPVIGFSKVYDHRLNPQSGFTAIMTCSQADAGCPFIPGAEARFSIPYEDPKEFDHTPQQGIKYRERSLQIATELFYVFSNLK